MTEFSFFCRVFFFIFLINLIFRQKMSENSDSCQNNDPKTKDEEFVDM